MDSLELLKQRIRKFNKDRDWEQFHTPENLAKSVNIEAGELLECFQWFSDSYNIDDVKDEMADVFVYLLDLADKLNIDIVEATNNKMDKNEAKYPVDKAKGKADKYDKI